MSVCVCDVFEIFDNDINYYHYQHESNVIIVQCIFQTHHTDTHTVEPHY